MNCPQKATQLEMHSFGEQIVIYQGDTDALHYLNATAAVVLEMCDGSHSANQIAEVVRDVFALEEPPLAEVTQCIESLEQSGLVK